jgi:hypothetical protein
MAKAKHSGSRGSFMTFGFKALTLGFALAAGLSSAASAQTTMKVGANVGNVPWEFQEASGKIVGFEIDLVEEIGKRNGMKVEIVNVPFQGLFAAVQSGQIDAAVSSITITKKRLESEEQVKQSDETVAGHGRALHPTDGDQRFLIDVAHRIFGQPPRRLLAHLPDKRLLKRQLVRAIAIASPSGPLIVESVTDRESEAQLVIGEPALLAQRDP